MDIYCEQTLLNENIDRHAKRNNILNIVRYAFLFIAGMVFITCLILPVNESNVVQSIITNLVIMVVICTPLVLAHIFLGKYINSSCLEYDYILSGQSFKIIKIINRKKRKLMLSLSLDKFESLGSIDCDAYDRYAASHNIKMHYALTDVKKMKDIFYIFYVNEGEKHLLLFSPNHDMMIALRKSVSRITIFDKSFKFEEIKQGSI